MLDQQQTSHIIAGIETPILAGPAGHHGTVAPFPDLAGLQEDLLRPVLGIQDPRTDRRIDFVGGIRGMAELERLVDSGAFRVAFALYPTTLEEMMRVADAGRVMPPKSTWFEPKLRSGLFVHRLRWLAFPGQFCFIPAISLKKLRFLNRLAV